MFHRILVALDQSELNEQVFDAALALAKTMNASLMLLHVLSPLDEGYPGSVYPAIDALYPELYQEALQSYMNQWKRFEQNGFALLQSFADEATSAGVTTEFTQLLGEEGPTICEFVRSWNADLVVVGRRGRTGLSEWLLGSVSNYVLHNAPCSVLTVQQQHVPKAKTNQKVEVASR